MAIRTELNLRLPNSPGALAGVCRLLGDERVNIVALQLEGGGQLHLVVDNHVHAAAVLREHHYQVGERNVLLAPLANGPGTVGSLLTLVAQAGVNVEYAYATTTESPSAAVVIGVDDAMRASAAVGT